MLLYCCICELIAFFFFFELCTADYYRFKDILCAKDTNQLLRMQDVWVKALIHTYSIHILGFKPLKKAYSHFAYSHFAYLLPLGAISPTQTKRDQNKVKQLKQAVQVYILYILAKPHHYIFFTLQLHSVFESYLVAI